MWYHWLRSRGVSKISNFDEPDVFKKAGRRVAIALKSVTRPLDWASTRVREAVYRRQAGPELLIVAKKASGSSGS